MSGNDPAPNEDFFAQLDTAADAAMPKLLQRLQDAVETQGRRRVDIKCTHCGHKTTTSVEVADIEETRKIVELFGSLKLRAKASQKGDDDASKQARAILREIAEMSDEEIAEELARLDEVKEPA